jgi:hypothetical protein
MLRKLANAALDQAVVACQYPPNTMTQEANIEIERYISRSPMILFCHSSFYDRIFKEILTYIDGVYQAPRWKTWCRVNNMTEEVSDLQERLERAFRGYQVRFAATLQASVTFEI